MTGELGQILIAKHLAAPVIVLHQVRHLLTGPAVGVFTALAEALAHQHQSIALIVLQGSTGERHCVIIQEQLAVYADTVGVRIQQHLVAACMLCRVIADHAEQFIRLFKSLILCGVQMYLTHVQRLIAAIDILRCAIVEPHARLVTVEVGHVAALTGVSAGLAIPSHAAVLGQHARIVPAKASVLNGLAKRLEHVGGDLLALHLLGHDLKHASLQNDLGILRVHRLGKCAGLCKMHRIVL